jgi:hypothetical protein
MRRFRSRVSNLAALAAGRCRVELEERPGQVVGERAGDEAYGAVAVALDVAETLLVAENEPHVVPAVASGDVGGGDPSKGTGGAAFGSARRWPYGTR